MYLVRYHDIAASAIYRILKRLGINRLSASQHYQRYEKQLPGNRVQIDVKLLHPIGTADDAALTPAPAPAGSAPTPTSQRRATYYQFTAIDDCTRLRILRMLRPEFGAGVVDCRPARIPGSGIRGAPDAATARGGPVIAGAKSG
ncbi:hypothetical protein F4561_001437 [Lipingzhangella halophila]|uniref:Uncharacterized protein n=2 Tax=Lipingzhangella halophila TaxID=1783352 RepID=A0A7W7REN8_9ACTN|nr:hypothetical protein [Lipingzhangella halophila]